jgi:hypothetical protein
MLAPGATGGAGEAPMAGVRTAGVRIAVDPAGETCCPACGPVPAALTSRYCQRHLRQMYATWLARGGAGLAARPAAQRPARTPSAAATSAVQ